MKPHLFFKEVENQRILAAIRSAEDGSSSDIVVLISQKQIPDALRAAEIAFEKLRLEKSVHRNSLLIFVAPLAQTYAIVGGPALHAKVGQIWWEEMAALLGGHFKEGRFEEGLIAALEKAGRAVKLHFPSAGPQDRSGQQDLLED